MNGNVNVLLIGSGGREHALAHKLSQSQRLSKLYIAPGNAGTGSAGENVPINADDSPGLVTFARAKSIDLVVVGPEAPLAQGLADDLRAAGTLVFGPSKNAAQIEASKSFAKSFMERHRIPTARYATFSDFAAAEAYLSRVDHPIVIKASGLAAGKGVIIPESMEEARAALEGILQKREFGAAGDEVVIEERLSGEEVSLLAFTDGSAVKPMPPAQDHKRLLDNDQGPNTGGMGAYAPAPICPPRMVQELTATILQPTVDGLRKEGYPFVGVLYAGLMLTSTGPRVLEFNCRFGDPETQALIPLLDSDLLEIALACAEGRLYGMEIAWKTGAAACVVLASEGYPAKYASGRVISGLDSHQRVPSQDKGTVVFHAGTRVADGKVVTAGGRVLGVTGWAPSLQSALTSAYQAIESIHFEGMQYRRDIGHHALGSPEPIRLPQPTPPEQVSALRSRDVHGRNPFPAYRSAGVDIDAGNRAVDLFREAVRSTYGPEVLAGVGAFGGMFDATALKRTENPILVASTDGVGTKVKIAAQSGSYESLGRDIVNHCIDDILVQGARPLFFLDYIASSKLEPERAAALVGGMAAACREAGCAILGGETAEMPAVYSGDEFDVVGTIVGLVDRVNVLPRPNMQVGDKLVGLVSSGPHTNGYSLIRRVFQDTPLDAVLPELGMPLGQALLAPHRSYLPLLKPLLDEPALKGLVHITGGGFLENIPRTLPPELGAAIQLGSWPVPPLFSLIQERGNVERDEMFRVFNMGIGMIAIVSSAELEAFRKAIPEETFLIGELVPGNRKVTLA